MASACDCISFIFVCGEEESSFQINLFYNGIVNTYKSYSGTYSSKTYILYWSGTQWEFKDQSSPEIILYSAVSALVPCSISSSNWIIGDVTNFNYCEPLNLTEIATTSPVCPTPTPTPTPQPTPTVKSINECEPSTLYDMGVTCVTINPSNSTSNDGVASLFISGGTPPYTVTWSNGNISPAIGNLTVGSYSATVVDYYGDFTANTVCVLTAPIIPITPTPTPSATPIPTGPNFCMTIKGVQPPKTETGPIYSPFSLSQTFSVDSFVNGQPSWISQDSNTRVFYNTNVSPPVWQLSGTPIWVQVINLTTTNPPINNDWTVSPTGSITVEEGLCEPAPLGLLKSLSPLTISNPNIQLYVVKNDTICGCEGSIIANASEGNPPYEYSINNGITYKKFPIFDNLCSGVYTVTVKDYSGYTKSTQVTLSLPENPTTYVVSLSKTSNVVTNTGLLKVVDYEVKMNVNPPLPSTATLTFDIIHTNTFQSSITNESANLSTNTVLTINGTPYPYTVNNISTGTTTNTINGCQNEFIYITGSSEMWEGLTYTLTDELLINTSTTVVKSFTSGCDIGESEDTFYVTNLKINGCNCCSVQNITI